MSRQRIIQKVRKNADYQALARFLEEQGLQWEVLPPTGKGHPFMRISLPDGGTIDYQISCTPMGGCNVKSRVASLRRALIERGVGVGE